MTKVEIEMRFNGAIATINFEDGIQDWSNEMLGMLIKDMYVHVKNEVEEE